MTHVVPGAFRITGGLKENKQLYPAEHGNGLRISTAPVHFYSPGQHPIVRMEFKHSGIEPERRCKTSGRRPGSR
jgi:hypothetical protein